MPNGFQQKKCYKALYNTLHCAFKPLSWNPEKHIYIMQQQKFPNHWHTTKQNISNFKTRCHSLLQMLQSGWKKGV